MIEFAVLAALDSGALDLRPEVNWRDLGIIEGRFDVHLDGDVLMQAALNAMQQIEMAGLSAWEIDRAKLCSEYVRLLSEKGAG